MVVSSQISNKSLEGRQCKTGSGSLWLSFERVRYEVVRVKLKMQWKTQEVGNSRSVYAMCQGKL
jgi:hypothetical protein